MQYLVHAGKKIIYLSLDNISVLENKEKTLILFHIHIYLLFICSLILDFTTHLYEDLWFVIRSTS